MVGGVVDVLVQDGASGLLKEFVEVCKDEKQKDPVKVGAVCYEKIL